MEAKANSSKASMTCSISVNDLYGNETIVNILSPDMQIEKIKESAIKQLVESESSSNFNQFRLILVESEPRLLNDDKTAKQEKLENGDSAILMKSRNKPVSSLVKDGVFSHDGPTQTAINKATEGLPDFSNLTDKQKNHQSDLSSPSQVEQTFRKVLLALLDLSYKFMCFEEDVSEPSTSPDIDPDSLKYLVEMGFSEKRARKSLLANNMDKNAAMEWLLSHSEMESEDEQLTTPSDEPMDTGMVKVKPRKRFKTSSSSVVPNPAHLQVLLDMGFTKEQSIKALQVNGNNPHTACEWLLNDHEPEIDEPLSPDSELYKALITNPTIHIGLHDRKVLEALEDMVENPWRRNNWAYESAVGNVLLQILKLYNKYSSTSQS